MLNSNVSVLDDIPPELSKLFGKRRVCSAAARLNEFLRCDHFGESFGEFHVGLPPSLEGRAEVVTKGISQTVQQYLGEQIEALDVQADDESRRQQFRSQRHPGDAMALR